MICPKTEKQIAEIDCCKCVFYFKETKNCVYKNWKPAKKERRQKKQHKKEEKGNE